MRPLRAEPGILCGKKWGSFVIVNTVSAFDVTVTPSRFLGTTSLAGPTGEGWWINDWVVPVRP